MATAPAAMVGASEVVEDEARRVGANGIAQIGAGGDVATHDAEPLGQRTVDDVDPVHHAVALGQAAAARAVHADCMHLVEVGQRVVFLGEVADRPDRRHQAIHRVDGFEGDHLGRIKRHALQVGLEVFQVVVAPDQLAAAAVADAGDHGSVVLGVGEQDAAGQQLLQGGKRGVVGDIGRREQQCGFLAVQVGQLALQFDVIVRRARDIARAAGAGAGRVEGFVHGRQHERVLGHSQVVVGAPHRDGARIAAGEVLGGRELTAVTANVGEHAVASLGFQRLQRSR